MKTILNQTIGATYTETATPSSSLWMRFVTYCKVQEGNRLLWLGITMAAQSCILTPMVVMLTLLTGPNFTLFMAGMIAMGIALVTNLAAMPTKITIPAFVLSILNDVVIAALCITALSA